LFELPETAHPKIRALYTHWKGIAPHPGLLPGQQHFDPPAVPELLPNLWLLEVVGAQPRRFRFRAIGDTLRRLGIPALPGDFLEPLLPEADARNVTAELSRVVLERQPVWFLGKALIRHQQSIAALERLHLPLATNGHNVTMLLCLTVFFDADGSEL
jgi:hypothetical protein